MNLKSLQKIYEAVLYEQEETKEGTLPDGTRTWSLANGHLHRVDGPALITPKGTKRWYLYGKQHRADGPAVESPNYETWYFKGEKHRDGGPAVVRDDGYQAWYKHGKRHREDGPAVIHPHGGPESYYINDHHLTPEEFEQWRLTKELLDLKSKEIGLDIDI